MIRMIILIIRMIILIILTHIRMIALMVNPKLASSAMQFSLAWGRRAFCVFWGPRPGPGSSWSSGAHPKVARPGPGAKH